MIKKSDLRNVFALFGKMTHMSTYLGKFEISRKYIDIRACGKSFCVCFFHSCVNQEDVCVARSYPMSYKAAYRLVCSL